MNLLFQQHARKLLVLLGLTGVIIVGLAASDPGTGTKEFRNLKVLPRNISSKTLEQIMVDDFQDGLGVSCGFCHANAKDNRPDYASDAKPEKEIARAMMRMTLQMNKRYFKLKHPNLDDRGLVVTCNTCHHGQPRPDAAE